MLTLLTIVTGIVGLFIVWATLSLVGTALLYFLPDKYVLFDNKSMAGFVFIGMMALSFMFVYLAGSIILSLFGLIKL